MCVGEGVFYTLGRRGTPRVSIRTILELYDKEIVKCVDVEQVTVFYSTSAQ